MCVIIWSPRGDIPNEQLCNAIERHPDGWGFAVPGPRGVVVRKSAHLKTFVRLWNRRPRGPVLFHARWATHGAIKDENCHPFLVRGHGLAVAHNGMIPGYGGPLYSDTRDFVESFLEPLPRRFLEDEDTLLDIEEAINTSKLAFMDRRGEVTIANEHLGLWRDGRWYSNATAFRRAPRLVESE